MRRGRIRLVGVTALVAGVVGAAFLGPVVVGVFGTARVSSEAPNPLPSAFAHLRFKENRGQIGLDARFVLRLAGAGVAFEASGPVLYAGAGSLRMRFVGGAAAPVLGGAGRLPGVTNYLIGSNPADWQVGILPG